MGSAETKIVVVDDDSRVRELLRDRLQREGYRVFEAADGDALFELLDTHDVDLVTLDVALEGESGLALIGELRRSSDVAIVMVTGRSELVDTVVGLELGADDYIGKPFEPRELVARVRSVLRRYERDGGAGDSGAPGDDVRGPVVVFGQWRLYPEARLLSAVDGSPCELSNTEFNLLRLLVDNPHRVLSRDSIMEALKGRDWSPTDRTVDNLVAKLRKKIECPTQPGLIRTVRGAGYLFAGEVSRG